ncbi:MAG: hypothetical protein ABSE18_01940 [Minisyncoccia bacterium]|jgi:orotate phosphoribosyltransferase
MGSKHHFDQNAFEAFMLDHGVVGFSEKLMKMKSGRLCPWYANWRTVAEDVRSIDELTDYVIAFVEDLGLSPDCFYGVPEGATKLGVLTQNKWAKKQPDYTSRPYVLAMGRGKPKEHGAVKDQHFLGLPRGKTIVLEDAVTTGGSLLTTVDILLEAKVNIIATLALTNRSERRDDGTTVAQVLKEKDIPYYALTNATEFLPKLFEKLQPGEIVRKELEEYFATYGERPLKL